MDHVTEKNREHGQSDHNYSKGRSQGRCTSAIKWSEVDGCWGKHVLHNRTPRFGLYMRKYSCAAESRGNVPDHEFIALIDYILYREWGMYYLPLFRPIQVPAVIQSKVDVGIRPHVMSKIIK